MRKLFLMAPCVTLSLLMNFHCFRAQDQSMSIPRQQESPLVKGDPLITPQEKAPKKACNASSLYGDFGEQWNAAGSLPDFGWAGYHTGLDPLPDVPGPIYDITSFGALPDDEVDDSDAIQAAINAADPGVVLIPKGRFIVTKQLKIEHGHMVIRGQGPELSQLYLPKSLGEVYGLTIGPPSNWSFSGGFISAVGQDKGGELTKLTASAKRGDQILQVLSTNQIREGQWIRIVMKDAEGTLLKALHSGLYPGAAEDVGRKTLSFYSPVTAITDKTIILARHLPLDINLQWQPRIKAVQPTVSEFGLEHFSMRFTGTPYPGHFKEQGYNAIDLFGVQNSWVRNIKVVNADYGINMRSSYFSTISDIVLDTDFNRGKLVGHHGLNSSSGADLLFKRFDIRQTFVHDLSVDDYAVMTIWSQGKGLDLALDHHGRAPYGILWTDINLGLGTRPFFSGGSAQRMPHSGAFTSFWNLRSQSKLLPPSNDFGPWLNFVATIVPFATKPAEWSIDSWSDGNLCQSDLYEAMLANRKKALSRK